MRIVKLVLLCLYLLIPNAVLANGKLTVYRFNEIDQTGLALTGPQTICVTLINPVRFGNAKLVGNTTTDTGVDVASALAGLFGGSGAGAAAAPHKGLMLNQLGLNPQQQTVGTKVDALGKRYAGIIDEIYNAKSDLSKDGNNIALLIQNLDNELNSTLPPPTPTSTPTPKTSDVCEATLADADPRIKESIAAAEKLTFAALNTNGSLKKEDTWPSGSIATLRTDIFLEKNRLTAANSKDKGLLAALDELVKKVDELKDGGDQYNDYKKKTDADQAWYGIVQGAKHPNSYSTEHTVNCNNAIAAEHTTITFKASDQVDISQKKDISMSVATVNCYARLALTQGAVYSRVPTQDFTVASAPGAGTGAKNNNTVQLTTNLKDTVYGIPAMVHYRLTPNADGWALSLSLGASTKSQTLLGLTVSSNRAIYFTAGVLRYEYSTLTNGFSLGQVVPAGTTLSTTKQSASKIGFALTFPLSSSLSGGQTKKPDKSKDNPPNDNAKPGGSNGSNPQTPKP